jgi:hypothetical protein
MTEIFIGAAAITSNLTKEITNTVMSNIQTWQSKKGAFLRRNEYQTNTEAASLTAGIF